MLNFDFSSDEIKDTRTEGTESSDFTRARGQVMGLFYDSELEGYPDDEVVGEGSSPQLPLPVFSQKSSIWPSPIQEIIDFGRSPEQRDILLLGSLTVIGATLGPKLRVMYDGKWLSPCMMLFVVAPPASGKGVLSWLRHIVQPFHDELLQRWQSQMREYTAKKLRFDYMGKERVNIPAEEIPVKPVRKYFIIPGNNSGTGMQANIIDSSGRGIIFEPEADTLSTALNADYGHFDDALRKTFDHEAIEYYRRTNDESRETRRTYLSMLLSGTPAQVKPLIRSAENGLFSRFMFYYMPSTTRWVNQFDRHEDVGGWFNRLGIEWKRKVDSLKTVSYFTFRLQPEQEDFFNFYMSSIFDNAQHTMGEEAQSIATRIAHHLLRIMSVVAFLRRIDDDEKDIADLFEPDNDVPAENVKDDICQRFHYDINDEDFNNTLFMGSVLYHHAMHILSLLPGLEITNRCISDKTILFSKLGGTFTSREYHDLAEELGIKRDTATKWITRGMKKHLIMKIGPGTYCFTHSTPL